LSISTSGRFETCPYEIDVSLGIFVRQFRLKDASEQRESTKGWSLGANTKKGHIV